MRDLEKALRLKSEALRAAQDAVADRNAEIERLKIAYSDSQEARRRVKAERDALLRFVREWVVDAEDGIVIEALTS